MVYANILKSYNIFWQICYNRILIGGISMTGNSFGDRLKTARQEALMTQKDVAKELNF